jgi:hypothetical protein
VAVIAGDQPAPVLELSRGSVQRSCGGHTKENVSKLT